MFKLLFSATLILMIVEENILHCLLTLCMQLFGSAEAVAIDLSILDHLGNGEGTNQIR
jgi:hypothetical protein